MSKARDLAEASLALVLALGLPLMAADVLGALRDFLRIAANPSATLDI